MQRTQLHLIRQVALDERYVHEFLRQNRRHLSTPVIHHTPPTLPMKLAPWLHTILAQAKKDLALQIPTCRSPLCAMADPEP